MILHASLQWLRQNTNQSLNTQDTTYLTLTGKLWGAFCEDFEENWLRYNGTTQYLHFLYLFTTEIMQVFEKLPCGRPWWRHQMETFSALLALCAGNSPVPVNSPPKGQWRGALMFSLIYAWINDWVNNREAGDLRRHRGHYDVIVMTRFHLSCIVNITAADGMATSGAKASTAMVLTQCPLGDASVIPDS